jgi:hypothetical protein
LITISDITLPFNTGIPTSTTQVPPINHLSSLVISPRSCHNPPYTPVLYAHAKAKRKKQKKKNKSSISRGVFHLTALPFAPFLDRARGGVVCSGSLLVFIFVVVAGALALGVWRRYRRVGERSRETRGN